MEEKETENFKYTQKNIIIGNKKRTVITIDKKPDAKLGQKKIGSKFSPTVSIRKKRCGGCSRRKRD